MKLKYIWITTGLLACITGCDDKLETYETSVGANAPTAIASSSVDSEAIPGQIKLVWDAPAENAYEYLQVKYRDPWTQEEICEIASKYTTELTIDNTLARFGDYSIYFQTFNVKKQGSEVTEIKAKSGAAPITVQEKSRKEFALSASQLSTNAQEPSAGPISNLVDGNVNNFFHTRWSSPQIDLPHYIQIDFKEAHENFSVYYRTRGDDTWTTAARPSSVELQISNDGESWETLTTLSGLPTGHGDEYTSEFVMPGKSFTYFRFNVIATSSNTKYFNMAEFKFYDVEVEVYDPETAPLD